jgi:hypothetical protein
MQIFFNKHYAHYSLLVSLPISLAIWTRAMLAYVGNKFCHSNAIEQKPTMNMLVIGCKECLEDVKEILKREHPKGYHQFVEATEATLPQGHLTVKEIAKFDTVVYDCDNYNYKTILSLLEETPKNTLKIATYSTKSGLLITESEIYSRKK